MSRSAIHKSYGGHRVLIAGGGVAALEAAFALRAVAGDLVDLELLTPEPRFHYQPQAVFEPFGGARVQTFELGELAAALDAQLTLGRLASVAPDSHVARTSAGMSISYDALLVACGASPRPVLRNAVTFRGPADADRIAALVADARRGDVAGITLAIPTRRTWLLPPYELAFGLRAATSVPVRIATVEYVAGSVLGRAASEELTSLLAARGIELETSVDFDDEVRPGVTLAAPELVADRIYGVPADDDGFIPVNHVGAVHGIADVWAAGDATGYDVKHGSLAAAQADAAAESIASHAGAKLTPTPFHAVLRARIACGDESLYVRRDLDNPLDPGVVSRDPLWSPAAKIFARHLSPALAELGRHRHGGPVTLG